MAAEVTVGQIQTYLNSRGILCLFCASDQLEGSSSNFDGGICTQEVSCITCGADWVDVYRLVSVDSACSPKENI
jgi:hypothetical protein